MVSAIGIITKEIPGVEPEKMKGDGIGKSSAASTGSITMVYGSGAGKMVKGGYRIFFQN